MLRFPEGFAWGVSTSSHQVEGAQSNDWTDWEARPGCIADGTRSGLACDWWAGRAEEDLVRARDLSVRAVRLSLEWSRLEPVPGVFDEAAFARYARILAYCRTLGLEPMLGLNHFTLPRWLAARGGWLAKDAAVSFARYAARCGERLAEHVTLWSTLNEPSVLAVLGYARAAWPPGRNRPHAAARALRNQLLAHGAGAHALRRAHPSAKVGLVLNAPEFAPARPARRADRAIARAQDWTFTGVLLHALRYGRLLPPLVAMPRAAPDLTSSFDWLGLNYYGRYRVHFDPTRPGELFGRTVGDGRVHTAHTDWGEVAPDGLRRQLVRLGRALPGTPLYVTENGMFDPDDTRRPRYLREHIEAVHEALCDGVDVRGYYVWTLIDNFEWSKGWSAPFGLFALDRDTQARTPRASAAVFARICRDNGL